MKTMKLTKDDIEQAAKILQDGEVLIFPTETVYGLGGIYDDERAFQKMVAIKKRPPNKPFALMCTSVEQALQYCKVNDKAIKIMQHFLPGELTVLVHAKENLPQWVTLGTGIIGIRVPDDNYIRSLFATVGKPCLVTSANRSGEPTSRYYEEVVRLFDEECAGIVQGECVSLMPSTIVNLTKDDSISLVREGPVPFATIESYWRDLK